MEILNHLQQKFRYRMQNHMVPVELSRMQATNASHPLNILVHLLPPQILWLLKKLSLGLSATETPNAVQSCILNEEIIGGMETIYEVPFPSP